MKKASKTALTQITTPVGESQAISSRKPTQTSASSWIGEISAVNGAYIHIPFCFHKCHYCDFFSIAGANDQHEAFVVRLIEELKYVGQRMNPLQTIFIGGGTPTLLSPALFDDMLRAVRLHLPLEDTYEWTIEANPETVSQEIAHSMVSNGVNRVSIGAQSFNESLLKKLERWHDPANVHRAVTLLQSEGIDNINLDLIYAIPSQTVSQVRSDLQEAIDMQPKHISCYALTYEPNTPLTTRLLRGEVTRVEHDIEAEMFNVVREVLGGAGFEQYEISNYAKPNFVCEHNLLYWKNKAWWPIGPAASGHLNGRRWRNLPRLRDYLGSTELPLVEDVELLSEDMQAGEAFMVGLRLLEGMDRTWVESLLAKTNAQWRQGVIDQYILEGYLHWVSDHLAFTEKGLFFADTVVSALLMQEEPMTDTPRQPSDA